MAISRVRVLVAEEDPVCLTTLTHLLQRRGYIVTAKASPEEALRAMQDNPEEFDLVMTVVRTRGPGIDGFELLRHAVKRYPVILFSGFEPWETVMRAIEGGACDFLTKPLRDEELRNIWQHVVRRRVNAASGAGAIADTRSSDVVVRQDGTASRRGSAGLDNSDEGDSGGSRKQGRTTNNKFNSPAEQHAAFIKAAEQLRGTEAKEIVEHKEGSGEHIPPHC